MTNLIQWQPQSDDKRGDLGIYGKSCEGRGGECTEKRATRQLVFCFTMLSLCEKRCVSLCWPASYSSYWGQSVGMWLESIKNDFT